MKKEIIKRNLWAMAFTGLLAFLLLPTETIAQNRTAKRGANDTYQKTTTRNRNTSKAYTRTNTRPTSTTRTRSTVATQKRDYNTRTRTATATRKTTARATAKRDYTNRTRQTANTRANDTYRRNRTSNATTNRGRAVNSNERNTSSNYRYTVNERNDYCRNYYTGITNWNRNFWNSIHYTPSYYDLTYRSFPFSNNLRAERFRYLGQRYWLYDGIWFRKRFGRYYAVDAPIGMCVDALPIGGEMIWYRGEKYVIYRGTAYRMLPFGGFQVVQMLSRF